MVAYTYLRIHVYISLVAYTYLRIPVYISLDFVLAALSHAVFSICCFEQQRFQPKNWHHHVPLFKSIRRSQPRKILQTKAISSFSKSAMFTITVPEASCTEVALAFLCSRSEHVTLCRQKKQSKASFSLWR